MIPSKSLETIDDVMCQTITTIDRLRQLEHEWNSLWTKVNGAFFQTYSFCFHSWNEIAKHANRSLICIVIRKKGQLVLVWPLMRYRRALWSIAEPLGPRATEYTAPLVEDSDFSLSYVRLAWQFLVKTIKSDIISLPFIKTESPLYKILSEGAVTGIHSDAAPFVKWQGENDWKEYYRTLSSSYRKVQNKKRRQLSNSGDVIFDVVQDSSQAASLISWLMQEKRKWAKRVNKKGKWVFCENYKNFLIKLASDKGCAQTIVIYLLKFDGRIIAAQLASLGSSHVDWMIAAFDDDYSRASPGILLNEHCLHWAFDRKLDCDFGPGTEENKMFWSKGNFAKTATCQVVITRWGKVAFAAWKVQQSWLNRAIGGVSAYKPRPPFEGRMPVAERERDR